VSWIPWAWRQYSLSSWLHVFIKRRPMQLRAHRSKTLCKRERERVQFVIQYEANVIQGTGYLVKTWMSCLNNLGTTSYSGCFDEKTLVIAHSGWFDYKHELIFCLLRGSFNLVLWIAWWKDPGIWSQNALFKAWEAGKAVPLHDRYAQKVPGN